MRLKTFPFPELHIGLGFLVQIQEFEKGAKFVHSRFKELKKRQYYMLRPAADCLQNIDSIASTLLYEKMIEQVLNETQSKYYNYAAKDLTPCGVLNSKTPNWRELQRHKEYLKETETKHKRKISFWSEYKSALQKETAKETQTSRTRI